MGCGFQVAGGRYRNRDPQGLEGLEQKTPLYEEHVNSHARLVPFAGFLMPIQYSGIIEEHRAVREAMGIFDLSHMGEFRVTGPGRCRRRSIGLSPTTSRA